MKASSRSDCDRGASSRRGASWFSMFCGVEWSIAILFFALSWVAVFAAKGATMGYATDNVRAGAHVFAATAGADVTDDAAALATGLFGFGAYFDQYAANAGPAPLPPLTAKEAELETKDPAKFAAWILSREIKYNETAAKAAADFAKKKREVSLVAHYMAPKANEALTIDNVRLCRVFANAGAQDPNLVAALDCLADPVGAGLPLAASVGAEERGCTVVYTNDEKEGDGRAAKNCKAMSSLAPLPAAPPGAAQELLVDLADDFYTNTVCYYLSFTTGAAMDPFTAQIAGIHEESQRMTAASYAARCMGPVV